MGSVINEGGVEEVRVEIKNVEEVKVEIENVEEEMKRKLEKSTSDGNSKEEIPPLDIKDYEELGLIVDLGELEDSSYENAGALSSTFTSLMELEKWIEIPPPEEFIFGGEESSFTTGADFDFELMEWIWELYTFDEYLIFYNL